MIGRWRERNEQSIKPQKWVNRSFPAEEGREEFLTTENAESTEGEERRGLTAESAKIAKGRKDEL
jgi:hypothetical protein